MEDNEIKTITDKAKSPCLVGRRAFEEDVQQFTCKRYNGENCQCHKDYINEIKKHNDMNENKAMLLQEDKEAINLYLDTLNIPRYDGAGTYSIVYRIKLLQKDIWLKSIEDNTKP